MARCGCDRCDCARSWLCDGKPRRRACASHVKALCHNLSTAIASDFNSTFALWHVQNSRMGWKYHICGTPVLRAKSWVRALLDVCGTGQSVAQQCSIRSPLPHHSRLVPPLLPAVREFLETLAKKLHSKLLALARGEGSCYVSDFARLPLRARYLMTGLRRQRCAVVGNSPIVRSAPSGDEIDRHDVVIRFNFAPTRGYEHYVPLANSNSQPDPTPPQTLLVRL